MLFILMLLFVLVGSVPYLAVGAGVARQQHALAMHNYNLSIHEANSARAKKNACTNKINQLRIEQSRLVHKSYCFLNYPNLAQKNGCMNCDSSTKWHNFKLEMESLRLAGELIVVPSEPTTPYKTLVTWPVVKLGNYITSGEVKIANPNLIEELERLNDIPVLEKR